MMSEKIILTDCDGVLVDYEKRLDEFVQEQGFEPVDDHTRHYRVDRRYGISRLEAAELIRMFNTSDEIEYLSPFESAVEYVTQLNDEGYRFIVVSSLGNSMETTVYREINLNDLFGDVFDDIICLPFGQNKKATLSKWEGSGCFWIEDRFDFALDGHDLGLKSILVDRDHNEHQTSDKLYRVYSPNVWEEIYSIIKGTKNEADRE